MSLRPILAARTRRTALGPSTLVLLALILSGSVSEAVAATFTVNSADDVDDGTCDAIHCSLREAISAANVNSGTDTIAFDIPGAGPHTIQPTSALPTITDPVVIDGYTQPGASPNTNGPGLGLNTVLKIELDGTNAGFGTDGLRITAGNSTVRGLVINHFDVSGVLLLTSGGNVIEGNFIGTDITGTAAVPNGSFGVEVGDSINNIVGGTQARARNVISGNARDGIGIGGILSTGNQVLGNYVGIDATGGNALPNALNGLFLRSGGSNTIEGNVISGNNASGITIAGDKVGNLVEANLIGTDVTGTADLGNAENGVLILDAASSNTIGGTTEEARNVISGNQSDGVAIEGSDATGNVVQGNFIGTDLNGTSPLGNSGNGVRIRFGASNNTVGGTTDAAGNTIAFNGGDGAFVSSGTGNAIHGNSIFSNGLLGIDLVPFGVTANDPGDGDTGANNRQNFPVLTLAASGSTVIEGTFNSAPNTEFRIELFSNSACDPSGHGEGETLVGSTMVTTDGSGNAAFSVISGATVPVGHFITATATDPDNNTSEFSQCMVVGAATTPIPSPTASATPTITPTPTPTPVPQPCQVQSPECGASMSLSAAGDGVQCKGEPNKPTKCTALFDEAAGFQLIVNAVVIPEGGYVGFASEVVLGGLIWNQRASCSDEVIWPALGPLCVRVTGLAGQPQHGGGTSFLPPFPKSNFIGTLVELDVQCPAEDFFEVVLTVLGDVNSEPTGSPFGAHYADLDGRPVAVNPVGERDLDLDGDGELDGVDYDIADALLINCVNIPPTPTPTATSTPTDTPTATPTPTPPNPIPPNPRWLKQDLAPVVTVGSQNDPTPQDPPNDGLSNLWLTRQGTKIPPLRCEDSTDTALFREVLSQPIRSPDPKGVHEFQILGAFEFEVRFDPKLVCVNLVPGESATSQGMICLIEDKDSSLLEGIARMGCVTKGKTKSEPLLDPLKGKGHVLAYLEVRPQPELYSQVRANQDNGVVAQLLDQDCELADEQGQPIAIFSCEDADVTVRYLEGDVEPDCVVDAIDQQAIAFRWGSQKGSLLYNERFDLEPSGAVKGDGDVDIKDLQFVFGRHGSSCAAPHPRQAPVNPQT